MKKRIKTSFIIIGIIVLCFIADLICIFTINRPLFAIREDNGDSVNIIYKGILYDTYNCHEHSSIQIVFKGKKFLCDNTIKPSLFDRNEIIKIEINNYSQYKNFFEYTDNDTIDKIYNLLKNLETNIVSKSSEPENLDELYTVTFFNDENMLIESDNDIFKAIVHVYRKNNKYYAEQIKNGIYEITEEDFNMIKNYAK